ncbi:alpha/beta-hydrolase [Thozetella sp. PMI_491]|nr:alpha/beta-hydrolase [Thozetella sp. PMI_491]
MSVIKKAYAETSLGQIHYRYTANHDAASASHPILFLHMSASSSASCESLMLRFAARGFASFAPDMPGFGQSFDPDAPPPSLEWYAQLYLDVFAEMPAFKNGCHILGHHSGAPIGVELAVLRPSFVNSLAMLGPVVMLPEARAKAAAGADSAFNEPVEDGAHLLKTWEYLQQPGRILPQELDLLQREALDHIRAWQGRLQVYKSVFSHDGFSLLPRVQCPVLAMCPRDDVLWPHFHHVKEVKADARTEEVVGGVFALDRGTESVEAKLWSFLQEVKTD